MTRRLLSALAAAALLAGGLTACGQSDDGCELESKTKISKGKKKRVTKLDCD